MEPRSLDVDSEVSDQTGRMSRQIWVFARRTRHFVGFVMRWLIMSLYDSMIFSFYYNNKRLRQFSKRTNIARRQSPNYGRKHRVTNPNRKQAVMGKTERNRVFGSKVMRRPNIYKPSHEKRYVSHSFRRACASAQSFQSLCSSRKQYIYWLTKETLQTFFVNGSNRNVEIWY